MKKITFLLIVVFCFAFISQTHGQLVANQNFNTSGVDADSATLTIIPGDITVNEGQPITSVSLANFVSRYNSPTGGTTWCNNWYAFDLNVTGGVADGTSIIEGCAADFEGLDVTGFTAITLTAVDIDAFADLVFFYIDLVVTYDAPSCPTPSALTASNATLTSAELSWTENGTASNWDIEWGSEGFEPSGTPNVNDTGNNPYELTGLTESSTYDFYVRADCSADDIDVSAWAGPFSFSTIFTVPDCATTPFPVTGATGVSAGFLTLTWSAPETGPTPTAYNIYVFDDALGTNPTLITTETTTSADVVIEAYNLEIFWAAIPVNGTEEASGCAVWSFTTVPLLNDVCADALPVSCDETVSGSTRAPATNTGGNAANDVWYSYTGTGVEEDVTLDLCASNYDTAVRVYDACSGTQIAFNDDSCGTRSLVTFNSDGTSTYYIMVEGWNTSVGEFSMTVTCAAATPPPANNDCANAEALSFTVPVNGTTVGATQNLAEDQPTCDLFGAIADVWYSVTLSEAGNLSVSTTLGTASEANIAVYSACGGLAADSEACSDDNGGEDLTITNLTAGTYYLRVWNNGVTETGTFDIVADFSLSNDEFNDQSAFNFYPNPVKDILTLTAQNNIEQVTVFNMLGQAVLKLAPNTTSSEVDMTTLGSGTYFAQILINDIVKTVKVMKQ